MGNFILIIVLTGVGSGNENINPHHIRFHTEAACKTAADGITKGVKQVNKYVGYYVACMEDAPDKNR